MYFRCNGGMYFLLSFLNCILQQTHVDILFPRIRDRWPILATLRVDFEAEIKLYSNCTPSPHATIPLHFSFWIFIFFFFFTVVSFIYVTSLIVANYTVIFLSLLSKMLLDYFFLSFRACITKIWPGQFALSFHVLFWMRFYVVINK